MFIVISSGHGKYIRGASGPSPWGLDEVDEARRVTESVADYLRSAGVTVKTFHDNTSHDQSTNLSTIVNYHNAQGAHDLDVSIHFNAYQTTTTKAMGTECLYVTQEALADKVSAAIAHAGGFIDRGPKYRSDLYFLNNTRAKAVLVETCFCDAKPDCDLYRAHYEEICRALAGALSGLQIPTEPPDEIEEPPPDEVEPPPTQVIGTVVNVAADDVLNIRASASASSPIIGRAVNRDLLTVVGSAWNGDTEYYKCKWGDDHEAGVAVYGYASAAYIAVDDNIPDVEGDWRNGITATVFGNSGDEQDSAYPDIDYITGSTRGVALPFKWKSTPRPKVTVRGPRGETTTDIVDLGPWNTNDPNYVNQGERPLVEQQYEDGTPAQNGQVPTNDAAIDLTKPIADAVGIDGRGKVSWRFA